MKLKTLQGIDKDIKKVRHKLYIFAVFLKCVIFY